ncbi:winged helix-turn-helix domain-containing protein [Amycolatopsis benzoatilytica]|uniref:winged helix-turn-helix domain-containing protein n=1 Tax=Amycolatopsis benzoatilytica TaxID=346045 RepID=UPI000364E34B|nr:helix-turn-helix domain-containing protein [Amycolatopsis benzoatilytica]
MALERRTRQLDPRTLRALAHPLRMELLDLLTVEGPATATGLGKRVGESSGTTSWHLRQLADAGLVEEDPGRGSKRERWWKAAQDSTRMEPEDFLDDPRTAGTMLAYMHHYLDQNYREQAQAVADLPRWTKEWRDSSTLGRAALELTPGETRQMVEEIEAVVDRYRRPAAPGDETVIAHWAAFPRSADETT